MSLDRFRACIPFPLVAANDANCSCFAELTPEQKTYLFVSLNESVGGALMLDPGDTANADNKRYSANYARFEGKDDGTPPVLTVTYQ